MSVWLVVKELVEINPLVNLKNIVKILSVTLVQRKIQASVTNVKKIMLFTKDTVLVIIKDV